ncbi:MAG: phosphoribosylamine--glycine ligase, partial [Saprospiraceae bacterium]|nr:phosphoribosylamine--glycine ligase [Saprospiraceae bacterium]
SKAFAKQFMLRHAIPTASYCEFGAADLHEATKYLDSQSLPIVLKADGLAAGKGVIICADRDVAKKEISEMLAGKFGDASAKVVVEAFLDGLEFSVFAVTDGESYRLLPVAKDYKRIGEGDTGLNTGGMGSISPVPFVDQAMMDKVEERIVRPTIAGIKSDGLDYKGFLFFGLIEVDGDPFVIEYNCRMGDPETQSVFPRIQNDLLELCIKIANRGLKDTRIDIDAKTVATVVMVSGGYPGSYEKGKPIEGLNNVENSLVFHAATKNENGQLLSSGGRVLAITSYGQNMKEALAQSYNQIKRISFDDAYYRADIGFDL